jgi:hypothetical protein
MALLKEWREYAYSEEMLFVILSTMEEICSMLETSCVFDVSTSFMAESIT